MDGGLDYVEEEWVTFLTIMLKQFNFYDKKIKS